jgi:phosphate:Na+ symporter
MLAGRLGRLFRTADEDLGKPQHLDKNVLATPALALAALRKELERLLVLVGTLLGHALRGTGTADARRGAAAIFSLGNAASEFATSIRMEQLPRSDAEELPRLLRIARYLQEGARLATETDALRRRAADVTDARASPALQRFVAAADRCLTLLAAPADTDHDRGDIAASLRAAQRAYQNAKSAALDAAVLRTIGPDDAGPLLDALSRSRRAVEQLAKASRMLRRAKAPALEAA